MNLTSHIRMQGEIFYFSTESGSLVIPTILCLGLGQAQTAWMFKLFKNCRNASIVTTFEPM